MKVTDGEKTISLQRLAAKLCDKISGDECKGCYDGSCPAADLCRHQHNGMVELLRKLVNE